MAAGLMSSQAWLVVWLLLILKLPIAYLAWVVWWAIKAEPAPPPTGAHQPALLPASPGPCHWQPRGRQLEPCRRRPPSRPRRPVAASARAAAVLR